MASNMAVLNKGKLLSGPGIPRSRAGSQRPVRGNGDNGSLPTPGQIESNTGLQSGGIVPKGSLPAAAPGTNPPSPDPSSYLVPGSVSQTPFAGPLPGNTDSGGIMSHTTTIFGYTAPTVLWVGLGAVSLWILYTLLIEDKKKR